LEIKKRLKNVKNVTKIKKNVKKRFYIYAKNTYNAELETVSNTVTAARKWSVLSRMGLF